MSIFSIYVLGGCISGIIFLLLTNIPSFFEYLCSDIDKTKNEIKNSEDYSDMEMALLNEIDNNSIIDFLNIIIALLSWVGLIFIIMHILSWLLRKCNF